MELILIFLSILLSWACDIESNWDVLIVRDIPQGLPSPEVPKLDLWFELLIDAFAIAIVSYSITVSLALQFAQKQNYDIDFNQELLAVVTLLKNQIIILYFTKFRRVQRTCAHLSSLAFRYQQPWRDQCYSINLVEEHNWLLLSM